MYTQKVPLESGEAMGVVFELQNASLIVIKADKGYLMCGYLDIKAAETKGDVAVKVKGVSNIEEALEASIVEVSTGAKKLGARVGMSGRDALERFC